MRGISTSTAAATTLALCSILTSSMAAETTMRVRGGGGAKVMALGDVTVDHKASSKSHKSKKASQDMESMYPTASALPTATAFPTMAPTLTLSPTTGKKEQEQQGKGGKGESKSKAESKGKGKGKKCPSTKTGKGGSVKGSGKAGKTKTSAPSPPGSKSGKGSKKEDDFCEEDEPSDPPSAVPNASPVGEPTSTLAPTITGAPSAQIVTEEPTTSSSPTNTPAPTTLGFGITMDLTNVPPECRAAFNNAASRWEEVIIGDLVSVDTTALESGNCPNLPPVIDDIFLCATIAPNDGVGGVLGSAGPEFVRQDTKPFTTTIGAMTFDSDDIALLKENGTFDSVILHEMGHVLGFGTLWDINGFTNSKTPPCTYIGASNAQTEWQALSGCTTPVPVEQGFGAGTQCSHWDDTCFVDEIMTGFSSGSMPISRVTIGSLEDMGYEVDYSAADPFTSADLDPSCVCSNLEAGSTLKLEDSAKISVTGAKQLGRGTRRKLSDVGRTKAFEYGEMLLLERKIQRANMKQENDSVLYVGDQIVVVLYEEEGELYGVEVRGKAPNDHSSS